LRRLLVSKASLLFLLICVGRASADAIVFDVCLSEDRSSCSETQDVVVDSSCGRVFYSYRGRISWPPIRCDGNPVTLEIVTHESGHSGYPVFVGFVPNIDSLECRTDAHTQTILAARGGLPCGGVTESIGPIDLARLGITRGEFYRVQAEFVTEQPGPFQLRSVGLGCIRVVSRTVGVATLSWSRAKTLYRDVGPVGAARRESRGGR
jgi:hypothetical protein